ncbi:MAG TPA: hypothetical protein VEA44_11550 [Caulobacter sp.]|nr:hypothetical protein [Caulobacter sp.]
MTRRAVVAAGTLAGAAEAAVPTAGMAADLDRYVGFGSKRSGGAGDEAGGQWLASRLEALGYATRRQAIEVPFIEDEACDLILADGTVVPLLAQAPWVAGEVSGRLFDPANGRGEIAVVRLSHARWSTSQSPEVRAGLAAARAAGARGVVLVTNGPSGEALALNALPGSPEPGAPVQAVLAPSKAGPVLAALASGQAARLRLAGRIGRRPAWNLIGELDRRADRWLCISTPRSGWFACAGERGPGIAVWLALAAWAARAPLRLNVALLAASGHEFENHGGHLAIAAAMPPPSRTALWLHLGANLAARDWHETGGQLLPLSNADSQRFLVATPDLLPAARAAFAGLPGLEAPYPSSRGAAGELGEVLKAGYAPAAGVFGAHRLHHAACDDMRCLHPPLVEAAAAAAERFLRAALAPHLG